MKNVGPEIDKVLHQELLESFIKFIEYFSPVLTKAEEYKMHVISENLIDADSDTKNKMETVNEMTETLSCVVPHFIKFAQLESKLEKFYK
jgi:hypothetical protein